MKRVAFHMEEVWIDLSDALVEASRGTSEIPAIDSRSELLRAAYRDWFESLSETDSVDLKNGEVSGEVLRDLIPDRIMLEREEDKMKKEKKHTIKGSRVAHTFSDLCDRMFQGPAKTKTHPNEVESISEGFTQMLEHYVDSEKISHESAETQREAIRERVERYRAEYEDAQHAPRETMRETPVESRVGAEVRRLTDRREEFVDQLTELASTERFTNPDDLMKALAYDYGVTVETVSYVLDEITPDGTDGRQALKSGSGVDVPELVDEPQIDEPESEVDALPEGAVLRTRDPDALSRVESHTDD